LSQKTTVAHIKTSLLNGMSYVRASEGQVLKSTNIALVLHGVSEERTLRGGQLAAHINGSGTGVALDHAGTL
jgi:hypothetical protein